MVRLIIVDDEECALDELDYIIRKEPGFEICGAYTNPLIALSQIIIQKPDVVFLDIEMPELNGLSLAKEMISINSDIKFVFITSYDEYALKAFEVNAFDYILKPIDEVRFKKTLDKLKLLKGKKFIDRDYILEKLNSIENSLKLNTEKIVAFSGEEISILKSKDILYLEVQMKEVQIVTKQGKYTTKGSLEYWENKLVNNGFIRCHRSFLVNSKHMRKISPMFNKSYSLFLEDCKTEIPVAKNFFKRLKTFLDM